MDVLAATLFYDSIIALIVAVIPLFFVELWRRWPKIKRRREYEIVSVLLAIVWLVIFYGSFIAPKILTVREYPVSLGRTGKHLRIAVLADFHLGVYRHAEWVARVVKKVNALHPDAVIIAGDSASNPAGLADFAPLRDLESRFGSYAVLGNHDYHVGAVGVRKAIESYNVEVLTNESVPIALDGQIIRLAGLDDIIFGSPDWPAALAARQPGEKVIVAVHNPRSEEHTV